MTRPRTLSRRRFLSYGAGAATSLWLGRSALGANEKLDIAIVGVANKGWHNVQQLKSENIVALCDIDANYLAKAAETYPKAAQYRDYRKMLEKEANRIDAVVVSTADHTHAPATSVALDLRKHVYCEKPLAHTVREARALATLARRKKVATQMGTQIHAGRNYRRVVELVQGGAIGKVGEVYTWCNKGWSNGRFQPWDKPVPAHIDWDLWLGPAKQRPFSPNLHPGNWRRFWEFGSGTFGDMACHIMDLPFWALGLRHPEAVRCEGPEAHDVGTPGWVKATYDFPEGLRFFWSDGNAHFDKVKQTNDPAGNPLSKWGLGILFVGEKGMLAADYGRHHLLPQEKFEGFEPPDPTIPNSVGHWREWIRACKFGEPTTCDFDYSGALTETVLLGIVAYRAGKPLQWDAKRLKADVAEAGRFVDKGYRKGFEVVGLA